MKKVSVFSEKGGAGKSTLSIALAFELGWPVLDLDALKTATDHLRFRDPASVNHDGLIVDFPAGLDLSHSAHLSDADLIIIPAHATRPDLKGLGQTIKYARAHAGPNTRIALFASALTAGSSDMSLFVEGVAPYGLPILGHSTHRVAYGRAGAYGKPFGALDATARDETNAVVKAVKGVLGL